MVSLEKLQELNKWWTKGPEFFIDDVDLAKSRSFGINVVRKELLQFLHPGKIVIIKGPRRAGKTLLIKRVILELINNKTNPDDILYFSFDEIITSREMETMIRTFLSKPHSGTTYIFLDEVQAVKNWSEIIQGLYNSGILQKTSMVVTGSIAHFFDVETLPGRGTEGNIYYMRTASFRSFVISLLESMKQSNMQYSIGQLLGYNFTFNETSSLLDLIKNNKIELEAGLDEIYAKAKEIERYFVPLSKMFDRYIYSGGYPISINSIFYDPKGQIQSQRYEEIYNYIRSDAATITRASSGDPLKAGKAISGILDQVGQKVSYSKIARNLSMNKTTLIDYYDRLENSFAFLNIGGMKKSGSGLKESEVKKFYFSDIFMHYSAGAANSGKDGNLYSRELLNSVYVGTIIEEIVAGHLIRIKELDPMKPYGTYLKFYDGPGNNEIDFIYRREDNSNIGIEVKYQNDASKRDIKNESVVDDYILLTKSTESTRQSKNLIMPVCTFLAMLSESDHNL